MPVQLVNSNGSPTKAILIIWRSRVRNSPPAHTIQFKAHHAAYYPVSRKIVSKKGIHDYETIEGMSGMFPTETAYLAIFVSSTLISFASVILSLMINKRKTSMQQ